MVTFDVINIMIRGKRERANEINIYNPIEYGLLNLPVDSVDCVSFLLGLGPKDRCGKMQQTVQLTVDD